MIISYRADADGFPHHTHPDGEAGGRVSPFNPQQWRREQGTSRQTLNRRKMIIPKGHTVAGRGYLSDHDRVLEKPEVTPVYFRFHLKVFLTEGLSSGRKYSAVPLLKFTL